MNPEKLKTVFALGIPSVARVAAYKAGLKFGTHPVLKITADIPKAPFFNTTASLNSYPKRNKKLLAFGWQEMASGIPDWCANATKPWWQISDFDPAVGDIKTVWEASRFGWALPFAQAASQGDASAADALNTWLSDWCEKNIPYMGANWKCGQEASLRVIHLAAAALIMQQVKAPNVGLLDLLELHLKRIAPTMSYAIGQNNNHGTSEAAALFIGGSWLDYNGRKAGRAWAAQGRKWLENRAATLIECDGSFSQYSVNYHRLMLDTLSFAEIWRRYFSLPAFSSTFHARAQAAAHWLYTFTDAQTGDAPNLGANDGAHILQLTDSDYRDFRPSVQLAMALFAGQRAYDDQHTKLEWLGVSVPESQAPAPKSELFSDGGYALLKRKNATAILRFPRFRFRPSQADALHIDLWIDGKNHLRDGGTYSYNTDEKTLNYFGGVQSHNTMQFDDHDQMPRLSRFLFGAWLKTQKLQPISEQEHSTDISASITDYKYAHHTRAISLHDNKLVMNDTISGFKRKAVLRLRLAAGIWKIEANSVSNGSERIVISSTMPIIRMEIVEGFESRYYMQKTSLPVLEIECHAAGTITTEYHW